LNHFYCSNCQNITEVKYGSGNWPVSYSLEAIKWHKKKNLRDIEINLLMGYNSPLIQMGKALKYSKMKYL
jgi:hypothetical protein